jgi:hypothetical protein
LARHDECLSLTQQAVSVSEACQEIRESLLSARLERPQQPQEESPQQQAQEEPPQQQAQEESPQQQPQEESPQQQKQEEPPQQQKQ